MPDQVRHDKIISGSRRTPIGPFVFSACEFGETARVTGGASRTTGGTGGNVSRRCRLDAMRRGIVNITKGMLPSRKKTTFFIKK